MVSVSAIVFLCVLYLVCLLCRDAVVIGTSGFEI